MDRAEPFPLEAGLVSHSYRRVSPNRRLPKENRVHISWLGAYHAKFRTSNNRENISLLFNDCCSMTHCSSGIGSSGWIYRYLWETFNLSDSFDLTGYLMNRRGIFPQGRFVIGQPLLHIWLRHRGSPANKGTSRRRDSTNLNSKFPSGKEL